MSRAHPTLRRALMTLLAFSWLIGDWATAGATPVTRDSLVGAWRLVRIEYRGPDGAVADPFYQARSVGLLIYDASGWMTVQIGAPHRGTLAVPAARSATGRTRDSPSAKAAAFDTYYAYWGEWHFEDATSVVTHAVTSSLEPAETGVSYAQTATFEEGRLVFTVRSDEHGRVTVRRKVWERL